MTSQELLSSLAYVFKQDPFAIKFIRQIFYVSELWDDLIDKDKDRSNNEITDAFRIALCELPMNPFYRANIGILGPVIQNVCVAYDVANQIEAGDSKRKEVAFWLRNGIFLIILTCIDIIGGPDWVREAGVKFIQKTWGNYDRVFSIFKKEVGSNE